MTSSFAQLPSASFAMSLKKSTRRSSRGSWRAKSITLAVGGVTSEVADLLATAGLLATAIVATSKHVDPATMTLAGIASPPPEDGKLNRLCHLHGANSKLPTTSATIAQRIKHAQT